MSHDRAQAMKWKEILSPYFGADNQKSAVQLAVSAVLFFGTWVLMYWTLDVHYALTVALAIPAAGFLMRLFMIQHDCGHGSFFKSQKLANAVGFVIGVMTLTPYHYWRKTHAIHHAHSGDLDLRTFGEIETLTVEEFEALTPFKRLYYRVYRNPLVLFGPGAAFHFLFKHRYPWDVPRKWKREWRSVRWTNLALVGILVAAWATIGLQRFLMVQIPITLAACTMGVWLFYVQHQYEEAYWHRHVNWNYFDAGLYGSSFLVLPKPLQWLTANIGLHHVHHLNSRIPNYRLQKAHDENPELWEVHRLGIIDGIKTLPLALWDEPNNRLISFREYRNRRAASALN